MAARRPRRDSGHGAEFPLAVAGRCIALTSRKGDLVLDPFVGSGTTAVAAGELGRRCLGFDISQQYVDVAERRLAAAITERQSTLDAEASATPAAVNELPKTIGPSLGVDNPHAIESDHTVGRKHTMPRKRVVDSGVDRSAAAG